MRCLQRNRVELFFFNIYPVTKIANRVKLTSYNKKESNIRKISCQRNLEKVIIHWRHQRDRSRCRLYRTCRPASGKVVPSCRGSWSPDPPRCWHLTPVSWDCRPGCPRPPGQTPADCRWSEEYSCLRRGVDRRWSLRCLGSRRAVHAEDAALQLLHSDSEWVSRFLTAHQHS